VFPRPIFHQFVVFDVIEKPKVVLLFVHGLVKNQSP
jgi:hypothetical protein